MIQTISASKGNYITVILDTCFSGHAQRNEKIMTQVHPVPRPASDQKTPTHEDSQLFVEGNADITRQTISDFRVGHPTHVLLGACSTDEFAREGKNGGIFTAALLQELRGPEHRTSEKDGDQYSMGNIPKRITWMDYMGLRGSASQDVLRRNKRTSRK
ncbi:hypothetical protein B0H13DRAFT_1112743 [Mycena leptocephala]|nr:hypothetical protein B0H13DRAFT_1112743 [Mycena leptocephala]